MTILPIHLSVSVYFCESHGIMAFFLYEGKNIGVAPLDLLCGLCCNLTSALCSLL